MTQGDENLPLQQARRLFERQCEEGRFPGGQLVVRHGGREVLNVAVGVARGFRRSENTAPVPVTAATRFALFSASKPVVAVAIAMLEERGALDVQAPVVKYFPEFGANGKSEITVLDVLTHRAGVFTPGLIASPRDWGYPEKVRGALIDATPRWPRGTLAYMPYEYGWILGEVVRGAIGTTLQDFIRAELTQRIPGLRFGATTDDLPSLAKTYWVGTRSVKVAGVELSKTFEHDNNLPEVLTAFVPAAGLVCSAADLASFYELLLGGGLISAATLARYTEGTTDFDRSNRLPLKMGRGFLLGSATPSIYGYWGTSKVFGHAGAFCTLGWADPELGLAVAIVTNGNRGPYDSLFRFAPLGTLLRRARV